MAYGKEKDDQGNKGRKGKGPKPMKGSKKARRESAKQERKNLLTENPVVNKSLSTGPKPKAKSNYASGSGTINMHKKMIVPTALVSKPALKSPSMKAMPVKPRSTDRNEMHATDFDRVSIDKNPSIKVITDEIRNIGMMDDNYNTGNSGKGPNPIQFDKLKKNK